MHPKFNLSVEVEFYLFLLEISKITALMLLPGELRDFASLPHPNIFSLSLKGTQIPPPPCQTYWQRTV
jgi:hypothetical protein